MQPTTAALGLDTDDLIGKRLRSGLTILIAGNVLFTLADLKFQPTLHAHYEETVMCARDGLPKMQNVPRELGGSGVLMPE